MSKLDFFCNRPTLVALIGFGLDLSSANMGESDKCTTAPAEDQSSCYKEKIEENGRAFVKGVLGYGKGRIVFYLNMDVDSVSVFLNKEDGSQLAMFVQESFVLDLKVRIVLFLALVPIFLFDSVNQYHTTNWLVSY